MWETKQDRQPKSKGSRRGKSNYTWVRQNKNTYGSKDSPHPLSPIDPNLCSEKTHNKTHVISTHAILSHVI